MVWQQRLSGLISVHVFQFWSAYVLCSAQNKDAVRLTLEQIDVIKRMCSEYEELEFVTTSQGDTSFVIKKCFIKEVA